MNRPRQSGMILPILAVCLLVGALALGVTLHQRANNTRMHQQAITAESLAQARALLRDAAQTYPLDHPRNIIGYLPCPDMDGDGSAEFSCPTEGEMSIGLFPYRTLGAPPLRDGHGECLWYAVAGTFKNSPHMSDPARMNWDTPGQFVVVSDSGRALFPALRPLDRAVAVVIAPGPAMQGQTRVSRGVQPCIAPGTTSMQQAGFIESSLGTPGAESITIITHADDGSGSNDQVTWLQSADIFNDTLFRQTSFAQDRIERLLNAASAYAATFTSTQMLGPPTAPVRVGNVEIGGLPDDVRTTSAIPTDIFTEWRDQFRYLRCIADPTDRCMNMADGRTCRGIVLFAGQSLASQNRSTGLDSDYFETNAPALEAPELIQFDGPAVFSSATPQQDLVLCL